VVCVSLMVAHQSEHESCAVLDGRSMASVWSLLLVRQAFRLAVELRSLGREARGCRTRAPAIRI
jgi:hypothetical protein